MTRPRDARRTGLHRMERRAAAEAAALPDVDTAAASCRLAAESGAITAAGDSNS